MLPDQLTEITRDPGILLEFLIENSLIENIDCIRCDFCTYSVSYKIRKRTRTFSYLYRCTHCRKEKSIFNNTFFESKRLSIVAIIKLIYWYLHGETIDRISLLTSIKSKTTVVKWCGRVRSFIQREVQNWHLGGVDSRVQIDESMMRGKRKANVGRMLLGNILSESVDDFSRRRNYGKRINGPWVLGFSVLGSRLTRFFYIENRKKETLQPLIFENVNRMSTIETDGWLGYYGLENHFFKHEVVNHSVEFVSYSGAHTQQIESLWGNIKRNVLRKSAGLPLSSLQSHLDFFSFLYRYKNDGLFEEFLKLIKK